MNKNYEEQMITLAIEIATKAHRGQMAKSGQPYIGHPIAVSRIVNGYQAKVVAMLHDVVEDTSVTLEDLKQVFPEDITDAIDAITRRPSEGETYDVYLNRVLDNKIATQVKLADMLHNMDVSRFAEITDSALLVLRKAFEKRKMFDVEAEKRGLVLRDLTVYKSSHCQAERITV